MARDLVADVPTLIGGGPWAFGPPAATARIRSRPEEFQVEELLGFDPTGEGSHLWLWVEKRGLNTEEALRRLCRHAGVAPREAGFSGRKDRHALTRQWFSLPAPGQEPDWEALGDPALRVIAATRHPRKLRIGTHGANRFHLVLRELCGEREAIEQRLSRIREQGVPNAFGPQRFGREGGNLRRVRELFRGRYRPRGRGERGLLLSTARAELFNRLLARRIEAGCWDRALPGEVLMLAGSNSFFTIGEPDAVIQNRLDRFDLHPSGPLHGRGGPALLGLAGGIEEAVLEADPELVAGLEESGLKAARRSLRLPVQDLVWGFDDEATLTLDFTLPAGAYATALLRELIAA